MRSIRQQVLHALRWTIVGRLVRYTLTAAGALVVVRYVSPADFGLIALANTLLGLLVLLRDLGLNRALTQQADLAPRTLRQVAAVLIVTAAILTLALCVAARPIATWFSEPRLAPLLWALSLPLALGALGVIPEVRLWRELEFRALVKIEMVAGAIAGATTVVLAVAGFGVWALLGGVLVNAALRVAGLMWRTGIVVMPLWRFAELGPIMAAGARISARQVLGYASRELDSLLVGRLLGTAALGAYTIGLNVTKTPLRLIMRDLNRVAFPAFAKTRGDLNGVRRYYGRAVEIAALVVAPAGFAIAALATDLVPIVLGPDWDPAIIVLQATAVAMPFRLLTRLLPAILDGIGRSDLALRNAVVVGLLVLPAVALGAHFGLTGVSVAWASAHLAAALLNCATSARAWGSNLAEALRPLWRSLACAGLMASVIWAVSHGLLSDLESAPRLAAGIATGVVTYALASLLINRSALHAVVALIRR